MTSYCTKVNLGNSPSVTINLKIGRRKQTLDDAHETSWKDNRLYKNGNAFG